MRNCELSAGLLLRELREYVSLLKTPVRCYKHPLDTETGIDNSH